MTKYIKLFDDHLAYLDFTSTDEFTMPNVSHCIEENEVHYNPRYQYIKKINGIHTPILYNGSAYTQEYALEKWWNNGNLTFEMEMPFNSNYQTYTAQIIVTHDSTVYETVNVSTDDRKNWYCKLNESYTNFSSWRFTLVFSLNGEVVDSYEANYVAEVK